MNPETHPRDPVAPGIPDRYTTDGAIVRQAFSSVVPSITAVLFLTLLFLAVSLPTGSIFGLNVKLISAGVFLGPFVLYLITSDGGLSRADVIFLTLFVGCLVFWSLVAVLNGEVRAEQIFYHLRDIASTVLIAWVSAFTIRKGLIRPQRLVTVIIYGMFALSAMKIALLAAAFIFNNSAVELTQTIFGQESLVPGEIPFGLFRMSFSADILGAFALFALLAPSVSGIRFGRISTLVISIFLIGSGFIGYSRYIWFIYPICFFAAMVVERKWKVLIVAAVGVLLFCLSYYDILYTVYEARFLIGADTSDAGRIEQSRVLIDGFMRSPLFGKGMGAHVDAYVNSDTHMYSYELQWLALLMQFGLVGEFGIVLLVFISARDLVASRHPAKAWMLLLFLLWLLASGTNPYLTTSFAGATFGLFMAMFYNMRHVAPKSHLVAQ